MKPSKFLTLSSIVVGSLFLLTSCATTDTIMPEKEVNISSYGPKTFNPNYVDETEKINALDAPVAESLDEVKDDQYVLVTLNNSILEQVKNYQKLYDGDVESVIMMTKKDALALSSQNNTVHVEPNMEAYLTEETNAVQSGTGLDQWGLDRIDQESLPLNDSYTYMNDASGVTVYVMDTGIRSTHTEFTGRIPRGFDTIGDGRGYEDCNGHGTHVAGTAVGTLYGVAKKADVVPVRVFGCTGSASGTNIVNGMNWIKANHSGGPAIVNLSLGGSGIDYGWKSVIDDMTSNGFIMVVSAGNDTANACNYSPAFAPNAITVGSTVSTDAISSFSNYGSCVDIMAPGSSIKSASYSSDRGTATMSGTSMSAPHVSGAVARLLQKYPSYDASQVDTLLSTMSAKNKLTSLPSGTPNELLNIDSTFAANDVVTTSNKAPSAPQLLAVKTNNVNNAPEVHVYGKHSGSNVSGYNITVTLTGQTTPVKYLTISNPDVTRPMDFTIDGLTNGTTYDVWVNATNTAGVSSDSNKITFTVVMP